MYFKKLLPYLIFLPTLAFSKVNVITTTTDLEWAVKRIGGDLVKVQSLLNGREDPHYVDATPTFISKVANADVFCFIGFAQLPNLLDSNCLMHQMDKLGVDYPQIIRLLTLGSTKNAVRKGSFKFG